MAALATVLRVDFDDQGVRSIGILKCSPACLRPSRANYTDEDITHRVVGTTVLFERYHTFAEVADDERVICNLLFPGYTAWCRRVFRPRDVGRVRRYSSR